MPTFVDQFKKTLRSEVTSSLLQGAAGVALFWVVLRYFIQTVSTPEPLWVALNFIYTVSVAFFCNYKLLTGRWSANLWAKRALALSLPLPVFYGYFTYLAPEYFAVIIIFVIGIELPVLGLAKSRHLTLWYAAFFFSFLIPLFFWKRTYFEEHLSVILIFIISCALMHFWLVRASNTVKKMGEQLTRHLVQTKQTKRILNRLHTMQAIDLTLARRLQRDTLPDLRKFETSNLRLSARYISLDTVGGDFYDIVDLGNNRMGLFIADVSGHGVAAALVTMMTKAAFRNHYRDQEDPSLLLQIVNNSLCGMLENQGMFVTAFYCILESDGKLSYSSAGHPPVLLVRKSENRIHELITENTFFLGIEPYWKYQSDFIQLQKEDRVFLYTDGLVEAKNKIGHFYGEERLCELLLKKLNLSPNDFLEMLLQDLQSFQDGRRPEDDIAILCADFS